MLGSSWDVSWHFRWLRDDLAPPHLLNSAGTAVVIGLVIFHSYTGYGVDRRALRLMQWGIGAFLVAVPIDIVNHRINGLDITSWSPSHGLLYLGTAIMLAGAIRGWWLYAAPGRIRDLVSLGLWLFFVENALFPNQHQEYGVLSLRDYLAGHTTAEPQLLDFAAAQGQTPTMFMLPVPSWVHPAWLICAGLLALVVARKVVGLRWTATAIAATYLAYRAVMWLLPRRHGLPALGAAVRAARRRGAGRPRRHLPGARAGLAGPLVAGVVYAAGTARRPWACCRRGTGGRCCPSPSASPCSGRRSTCLARSAWLARWRTADEPQRERRPRRSDRRRSGAEAGPRRLMT